MKPEEAIEIISEAMSESQKVLNQLRKVKELAERKEMVGKYYSNIDNCEKEIDACKIAIEALKEISLYKNGGLCLVPAGVYEKQCKELDEYKEIGTVEECREAVEKQKPKKPVPINWEEYADKIINAEFLDNAYICPNCKTVLRSGSCCNRCGQKLDWSENLEGMEDE